MHEYSFTPNVLVATRFCQKNNFIPYFSPSAFVSIASQAMPGRSRRTTGKKSDANTSNTQSAAARRAAASPRKRSASGASSASSVKKKQKKNEDSSSSSDSSNEEEGNEEDDDDDDDEGDDAEPSNGELSSVAGAASTLTYNTSLLKAKDSCAWKPTLSGEDYKTLQMLMIESVRRSMPHFHVQDPRAVENIARHLAWTQIWDLNQARANAYETLTPMNSAQTANVISNTVYYCVNLAVRSDTCVLFERLMGNEVIFQKLQDHLRETVPSITLGGQNLVIDELIGKAVEFVKSSEFLDLVCTEMFQEQGMPRFQCTEAATRKLFDEWSRTGLATEAMKMFAVRIVDRTSHYFINQRVREFLN